MPFSAKITGSRPRAFADSATANGMAPPPAIKPIGDEISKAVVVMASVNPRSVFFALLGRKTKRPMLAIFDESQNVSYGVIFARHRLHRLKSFGENSRSVKQLEIERTKLGQALAGKVAAPHANDVQSFKNRVLTVDESEWNDIAANAANAAHHDLMAYPGELVHGGQASDIDKIADFAVAAQCRRTRKDHIIADHAIMPDMAVIHEEAAIADPREAPALHCADIHGDAFANRASRTDLQTRRFATITEVLWRAAQRGERRYHAIRPDRGMPHDVDMSYESAVVSDHDVPPNDAIGTDRRAFADDGAVF